MKKYILLFIVYIFVAQDSYSYEDKANKSIAELDSYLSRKEFFMEQKEERIKNLKDSLLSMTDNETKLQMYTILFGEYKSYVHDSAFSYAQKHLDLALKTNNKNDVNRAKIQIGFCYLSSGLFKEALDILDEIKDIDIAPKDIKTEYYVLISRLYYDMADYSYGEPFSQNYVKKGIQYCDSAITYLSIEEPQIWSIVGLKRMQQKLFPEAIDAFQILLNSPAIDNHTYAIATSSIGYMYSMMGNESRAKYYLSQASIGDIKSATKEAVALQNLSKILYSEGDIQRANRYIRIALADADFYNARHRKLEISGILPMIEKERSEMVEKQRNNLIIFASLVSLLFILLLVSTIVIYKQINRLRAARKIIISQNENLTINNELLTEANEIKDEYIVQSLYNKSEYIDTLSKLHKLVERKLIARQYGDIKDHMKSYNVKKERENMFSSFDNTFIKLFPTYLEGYNDLFEEKDRVNAEEDNALTAEQRIFALIRLGINESDKIAHFLDYSVHTINTYKTKVKNKSIVDNDVFEDKIMEIKTVGRTKNRLT